jgi:hypothetical protein
VTDSQDGGQLGCCAKDIGFWACLVCLLTRLDATNTRLRVECCVTNRVFDDPGGLTSMGYQDCHICILNRVLMIRACQVDYDSNSVGVSSTLVSFWGSKVRNIQ